MYSISAKILKVFLDLIELVFIGAVVSFFVFFYIAQPLRVSGDSMLPNFHDKEQIIAEKISIKTDGIKRGDVIIFRHPDNHDIFIIKRAIGLPGEAFRIDDDGYIYIDGEIIKEPYLEVGTKTHGFGKIHANEEISIPYDSYILLGDNRSNSSDSRAWGPISMDLIVGKSFMVYYPVDSFRLTKDAKGEESKN